MRSRLDHLPAVQHDDPVRRPRRLQAVGDHDGGPPVGHLLHRGGDVRLGDEVEVRGRLVEQEEDRVDELGAGQRDQLALTGRQRPAALGQLVVVPAREAGDEVVRTDRPSRRLDLGVARLGPAVGDVVADRAREEERLLRHVAELVAELVQVDARRSCPSTSTLPSSGS